MDAGARTALVERTAEDRGAVALSRALFERLDASGIAWCVVGDSSELAETVRSDIDIVVDPAAVRLMPALIDDFAVTQGVSLVQALRHEAVACYFALAWSEADGGIGFLHPDICGDWWRNGRLFLPADEVLAGRVRAPGGFFVPSPARNALYYLLKRMSKGVLDERHGVVIAAGWNAEPRLARDLAERHFPAHRVALLAAACASGDWSQVRQHIGAWHREVEGRFIGGVKQRLLDVARRCARIAHPTGVLVEVGGAVSDADAEAFIERWRRAFRQHRRWTPRGLRDRVRLAVALRRSTLVLAHARRDPRASGLSRSATRIAIASASWNDGSADRIMLEALSRRTRARLGLAARAQQTLPVGALGEAS